MRSRRQSAATTSLIAGWLSGGAEHGSDEDRYVSRSAVGARGQKCDSGVARIRLFPQTDDQRPAGVDDAAELATGDVGVDPLSGKVNVDGVIGSEYGVERHRDCGERAFRRCCSVGLAHAVTD